MVSEQVLAQQRLLLQVVGANGLYVCDMSVMPFSSAANPVRTLAALALRLSRRLR